MTHALQNKIQNLVLVIFLLSFTIDMYCQKDSVFVITTYQYILKNFQNTNQKIATKQETYDSTFKLTRAVIHNNKQVDTYLYYFYYPNDSLKQIQYYNGDDQLVSYKNFIYRKGQLLYINYYQKEFNSTILIQKERHKHKKDSYSVYSYDRNKKLTLKKSISRVDEKGTIKTETEFYRNDSILKITSISELQNNLTNMVTSTNYLPDNKRKTIISKYLYDDSFKIKKIKYYTPEEALLYTDIFSYHPEGSLKRKIRTNQDGKMIDYELYDYKKYYRPIPQKELISTNF